MAIVYADIERHNPVVGWFTSHGAATALMGCAAFWILVASLCFIL